MEKVKTWWADPWLRVLQLSSAVCTLGALACWFAYMVLEDRPLGEWITPLVAAGSLGAALWARHTASVTAGIAKSDAQRRRYGWEIELQPKGKSYLLRNIGTVTATNVRFEKNEGFSKIRFRHEPSAQRIEHSEAREFYAFASWGSAHQEIQVTWIPEGETEEQTWTSAITITKDEDFENTLKEQRDARIREAQNSIAERREWTNRLTALGAAYSEYVKNPDDPGTKLRVQLLVASLPSAMAIEVGRQVDVARDLRMRGADLIGGVPDEQKHLVEGQTAQLELIWNMMQINGSDPSEGHSHRTEYNIWDVGPGAVTRIQRRMSGEWPTRYTHEDQQREEEDRRMFAEMDAALAARREELGLPNPIDDTDPFGDGDVASESTGTE